MTNFKITNVSTRNGISDRRVVLSNKDYSIKEIHRDGKTKGTYQFVEEGEYIFVTKIEGNQWVKRLYKIINGKASSVKEGTPRFKYFWEALARKSEVMDFLFKSDAVGLFLRNSQSSFVAAAAVFVTGLTAAFSGFNQTVAQIATSLLT